MRKIYFVIGTRAEAIKILPVCKALEKLKINYSVISTGQHDLQEFNFNNFIEVTPARGKSGAFNRIIDTIPFLIDAMRKVYPIVKGQIVVVHGDTMTTAAAAITGKLAGAIVCHLESGLRTGQLLNPFPEEISRIIADKVSQVHFAPTERAMKVTQGETHLVGNTVIDSIASRKLKIRDKGFIIVTVHRQENIRNQNIMKKIVENVAKIAEKHHIIWILSQNTEKRLKEYKLFDVVKKNCKITDLLQYEKFIKLLAQCKAVLSDSGGLAEECAYLKKPLIILRKTTERQESVENNYALLGFDFDLDNFIKHFNPKKKNIYGDGTTGKKVAKILQHLKENKNKATKQENLRDEK